VPARDFGLWSGEVQRTARACLLVAAAAGCSGRAERPADGHRGPIEVEYVLGDETRVISNETVPVIQIPSGGSSAEAGQFYWIVSAVWRSDGLILVANGLKLHTFKDRLP